MKRYVKADVSDPNAALADEYVAKYIELFADRGFEMKEVPAYGVSRVLNVVSVNGDNSAVHDGAPASDGYMMRSGDDSFWAIYDDYAYENLEPIDNAVESKMIDKVDRYVTNWLDLYDRLIQLVSEIHEIEPLLPSIADDFKTKYAHQFPDLELNISIQAHSKSEPGYLVLWGSKLRLDVFGTAAGGKKFNESYTWSEWQSGKGEADLVKVLTRIYKSAARNTKPGNSEIIAILNEYGIDTTKAKYELVAETYERFGSGRRYKKTFTCPGDYLAYFSMALHRTPNYNNLIEDYFGDITEFEEFVEDHSTLEVISDYASSSWWGDGDDYIYSLKNLNTGEVLYHSEEEDEYEEDEDEWED